MTREETLAEVEAKARAATPGPWTVADDSWRQPPGSRHVEEPTHRCITCSPADRDAAHIARCDPGTVLALLAEVQLWRDAAYAVIADGYLGGEDVRRLTRLYRPLGEP